MNKKQNTKKLILFKDLELTHPMSNPKSIVHENPSKKVINSEAIKMRWRSNQRMALLEVTNLGYDETY